MENIIRKRKDDGIIYFDRGCIVKKKYGNENRKNIMGDVAIAFETDYIPFYTEADYLILQDGWNKLKDKKMTLGLFLKSVEDGLIKDGREQVYS